jgi:hypothetical protein
MKTFLDDILNEQTNSFDVAKALKDCTVDLNDNPMPEPCLLSYGESFDGTPLCIFGEGDYSVISGVGGVRKSFLKTALIAKYIGGQSDFGGFGSHMQDKRMVIDIDTEQSVYRTQLVFRRVERMVGHRYPHYHCFRLRKHSPEERVAIIEAIIEKYGNRIGLLSIDGYADLINDTNDNVESAKLAQKVMSWTDNYTFHVTGILHENPDGRKMRGHLGSEMSRKASTILSVSQDDDPDLSLVYHTKSRDEKFSPFLFGVSEGLPVYRGKKEFKKVETTALF